MPAVGPQAPGRRVDRGRGPRSRGHQRTRARDRALMAAAETHVADAYDVVVVGGGAAGLAAAIAAGEQGARVLVLEKDASPGRSILATGNGRCNFCTVNIRPDAYNDPAFVGAVMGARPLDDILDFFRGLGLRWCLEDERLYPLSKRATSVRNVLLRRAEGLGTTLAPARRVCGLAADGGVAEAPSYTLAYEELFEPGAVRHVRAGHVVLATGGVHQENGHALASGPGLETAPAVPVLCPVGCEENPLLGLDGCRLTCRVHLSHGEFPCFSERGEVLVRSYGLSGIVMFNLSRHVLPGDLIELDLLPDLSRSELRQLVDPWGSGTFETGCLDGVLDPTIARLLERLARRRWALPGLERQAAQSDSEALMEIAKCLPLRATGTCRHEQAQVVRGGLATRQFSPETLECVTHPGLYAAGEALDVDGECGGFNLAWAWKSGLVAGAAAASAS